MDKWAPWLYAHPAVRAYLDPPILAFDRENAPKPANIKTIVGYLPGRAAITREVDPIGGSFRYMFRAG